MKTSMAQAHCSDDAGSRTATKAGRPRQAGPRGAALMTALLGLVNLLSVTTPALHDRVAVLQHWLPLEVRFGSHLAAALSGFALLVLAGGLARRKRSAWLLTVGVLAVSAASHLLKALDYEEALLSAGVAAWLIHLRPQFQARSDRPTVGHALKVLVGALVFSLAYGLMGLCLLDRHFRNESGLWQAASQVFAMFFQFDASPVVPVTAFGRYFADSIYAVAAGTMGYGLLALARPVLVRAPAGPADRARARVIVEAHGRSALAWFALGDDKSYHFSPGGSVIAYAVSNGVCVALGDVIGPPQDETAAVTDFCAFCARNDWRPAFLCAEPAHLDAYRTVGLDALCLGHEAVVPLAGWSLAGGRYKDIRGRVARLGRLGHVSRLHEPPLAPPLVAELRAVSDEWLTGVSGGEMGFFVGAFEESVIRDCPVMAIHGPDGAVVAFANLYPEFQRNEATVDLTRRRLVTENGVMEMLYVSLFEWAREQGYDSFNMGVCPLAGLGQGPADPVTERALAYMFERSQGFYNFQGAYRFKAKFHPTWSPSYLIHPGPASLPAVTAAVVRLHTGEGLIRSCLRAWPTGPARSTDLHPPPADAAPSRA